MQATRIITAPVLLLLLLLPGRHALYRLDGNDYRNN
jgi:hypothetical protein